MFHFWKLNLQKYPDPNTEINVHGWMFATEVTMKNRNPAEGYD